MKTLKQFYREIQQWIDDGCPEHEVFDTNNPLCKTLCYWGAMLALPEIDALSVEMGNAFERDGLSGVFPFNSIRGSMNREAKTGTVYQNPARLAWIKEHAA